MNEPTEQNAEILRKSGQIKTGRDIKKEQAVQLWRETHGNISKLCAAIPIQRDTFYRWLKNDKNFARDIVNAEAELNDDIRDVLIDKAANGDLGAIIFYLRKRHPDFADQPLMLQQFNIGKKDAKADLQFVLDDKPELKGGEVYEYNDNELESQT